MVGSQLLSLLEARAESERPLRVGLIGAGRFGTMFLGQALRIQGLHVLGLADLSTSRAFEALDQAGWPSVRVQAKSFSEALRVGSTCVTDDAESLIEAPGLEVLIEATGDPRAGVVYALRAIESGRDVVMATVESDVLVGPLLARRARRAGVVYSLAYGDQPALICELVEWARANGFEVICAGKGVKYVPHYRRCTPDTVWEHYGTDPASAARDGLNPRTYTAAIDGTKAAVEMAAVANATDLVPQPEGLRFPPCGVDDLAQVCRPRWDGGALAHAQTVEALASLHRDGRPVAHDLRHGVFVTLKAQSEYVRRCFAEYLLTDASGWYAAVYRPYHLVGLEVLTSVLKVGLRDEPTGFPTGFGADVVGCAKRALAAGTVLDGEGGYSLYGKLMRAQDALEMQALPAGLTHGLALKNALQADQVLRWTDVECDETDPVVTLRREMERSMLTSQPGEARP